MKKNLIIFCLLASALALNAQLPLPDSFRLELKNAQTDSATFKAARAVYTFYEETNRDSALKYAVFRNTIARQFGRKIEAAYTQGQMAYQQIHLGRFSEALRNLTEAFEIVNQAKDADTWELTPFNTPGKTRQICLSMLNHMYGHLKLQTGSEESLYYFKEGRKIGLAIGNSFRVVVADMVLATNYLMVNKPDSALFYADEGEVWASRSGINKYLSNIYNVKGDIFIQKGNDSAGLAYYYRALPLAIDGANISVVTAVYQNLVNYYKRKDIGDSVMLYAQKEFTAVRSLGAITSFLLTEINLGKAYENLAMAYSLKGDKEKTNEYLQLALKVKDSISAVKAKNMATFQRLTLDEQVRQQNEEGKRVATETKRRTYILSAVIITAIFVILLVYRNNRQKQKANHILQETLSELRSTQQQLIQSEKMASLGELTAGIAHEIQNPLNFVNNFSEVSSELVDEMHIEMDKGDMDEAKFIANDIKQNLEKINHHGKRADAIVKGMLQHSRKSEGQKEPTDINALCDEYLRLSYHGLRAKDKSFNAVLKTDFDESVGTINIVPQDMGRVIMNLLTNAFYAVNERKKQSDKNYEPTISVSTSQTPPSGGRGVRVTVSDNGNGIPPHIVDKIFQPFFTTKPTGQGTGLGLSLAYDIVKAHGGELKVQTKEGEGSTFILSISA